MSDPDTRDKGPRSGSLEASEDEGVSQGDGSTSFYERSQGAGASDPGDFEVRSTRSELGPGSKVGPYELIRQLGKGGMGEVWEARHIHLERKVALKFISHRLLERGGGVERFYREMKAAGRAVDPHIVQAYDAGQADGIDYLAMELVHGVDLARRVELRGPLSVADAAKAIRDAALGLAKAHSLNLVHRDVKPSNLLTTLDGTTKVLDLGLAKFEKEAVDDKSDTTLTLTTVGTPDFMAPEQWTDAHGVGPAADSYSLGCTLHFLLVGRAPFATERHSTLPSKMRAHINERVPNLKKSRPDVPPEIRRLTYQLMSKRPKRRPSAPEVARRLEPFIDYSASAAVAATPAFTNRNGTWAILGGVFVAILGLAVVVGAFAALGNSDAANNNLGAGEQQSGQVKSEAGTSKVDPVPSRDDPDRGEDGSGAGSTNPGGEEGPGGSPGNGVGTRPAPPGPSPGTTFACDLSAMQAVPATAIVPFERDLPFTVEAYVKLSSNAESAMNAPMPIFGIDGGIEIFVAEKDGEPTWQARLQSSLGKVTLVANEPASFGDWTHVAVTWDGSNVRLLIDGKTQAGGVKLLDRLVSERPARLRIDPFPGQIDDVRISNVCRYRSDTFIDPILVADETTVSLFAFEDDSPEVAKDSVDPKRELKMPGAARTERFLATNARGTASEPR